jgi:acetyl esterase/lipase
LSGTGGIGETAPSVTASDTTQWALPPERAGRPAPADLLERRQLILAAPVPPATNGITRRDVVLGGVAAVVYEPAMPSAAILYFHGGGFRVGHAGMWPAFHPLLATRTKGRVISVDYRLAPEHPFPAAVHDAAVAYEATRRDGLPVVVAGDSAGGGVAAALAVAASRSGVERPRGLVLVSPWVDLTVTAATYDSRSATDVMFSRSSAQDAVDLYLQGGDPLDPLASPLFADARCFPPTLLFAGGDEVLLDDTLELATRLARAGRTVELHVGAGRQHVWVNTGFDSTEGRAAVDAIARFVSTVTAD